MIRLNQGHPLEQLARRPLPYCTHCPCPTPDRRQSQSGHALHIQRGMTLPAGHQTEHATTRRFPAYLEPAQVSIPMNQRFPLRHLLHLPFPHGTHCLRSAPHPCPDSSGHLSRILPRTNVPENCCAEHAVNRYLSSHPERGQVSIRLNPGLRPGYHYRALHPVQRQWANRPRPSLQELNSDP